MPAKLPLVWPSQLVTSPLAFRHNTSSRPSPLKSPVPTTLQPPPGLLKAALPTKLPLIWPSQLVTSPLAFRHNTSSRPSPLKSPVPKTVQPAPGLLYELAALPMKLPLDWPSQLVTKPSSLRHRISLRPSPLKSLRTSATAVSWTVSCTPPPEAALAPSVPTTPPTRVIDPPVYVSELPLRLKLNPPRVASLITIRSPAVKSVMVSPLRFEAVSR